MIKTMKISHNMYNIRHIEAIKKSLVVRSAKDGTEINDYFK